MQCTTAGKPSKPGNEVNENRGEIFSGPVS